MAVRDDANMPRKQYRLTISSQRCVVCETAIRRGMPIVFVPSYGPHHNYRTPRPTVAIHAVCERLHDLAA